MFGQMRDRRPNRTPDPPGMFKIAVITMVLGFSFPLLLILLTRGCG